MIYPLLLLLIITYPCPNINKLDRTSLMFYNKMKKETAYGTKRTIIGMDRKQQ